jgi:hypothetical protein
MAWADYAAELACIASAEARDFDKDWGEALKLDPRECHPLAIAAISYARHWRDRGGTQEVVRLKDLARRLTRISYGVLENGS